MPRPPAPALLALALVATLAAAAPAAARPRHGAGKPSPAASPAAAMKALVADLSAYARARRPGFGVVANNAEGLLRRGAGDPRPDAAYLAALDGLLAESLHFLPVDRPRDLDGYRRRVAAFYPARKAGKAVLALDYAAAPANVAAARRRAARQGYLSFCADTRALDTIPASHPAPGRAPRDVSTLNEARDFLYLVNPGRFPTESAFTGALGRVPADLLVVDAFFHGHAPLAPRAVERLKRGPAGERRLVYAYLCAGEAESGRYYFKPHWKRKPPAWFLRENEAWPGSHIVRFWDPAWRAILFGRREAYLDRILAAGFDGVLLDTVDSYLAFGSRE